MGAALMVPSIVGNHLRHEFQAHAGTEWTYGYPGCAGIDGGWRAALWAFFRKIQWV